MNPPDTAQLWILRLLRVAGAALAGAALVVWVTPVNSPGRNLVPVGCGSPASPKLDELTDFVCSDFISGAKVLTVSLAVGAAVLLLLAEVLLPRLAGRAWVPGAALACVLAVPVVAVAVGTLFTTIAGSAADGTLLRCGTPIAPSTDRISRSICGQLADREKSLALGAVALAALAVVGGGYVSSARATSHLDHADDVAREGAPSGEVGEGEAATAPERTAYDRPDITREERA